MVDTTRTLAPQHLDQLRRSCGDVVTPDDAAYDDARRLWNADPRSAARRHRPADDGHERSRRRSRFAREHDLEIAVQSGGHAAAGLAGSRRRPRHQPVEHARRRGRSADADRPRERRRVPRRARHRRAGARPRLPDRRRRPYGRRRADARRGSRPPAAPLRADDRQPGRRRARRRPTADSSARPRPTSPSSSGACAAPAGTSGSRRRSSSGSSRSDRTCTEAS